MDKIEVTILSVMGIVIVAWFVGLIHQSNSPTFELYKNEFTCTKTHNEIRNTFIPVGKVIVPQVQTTTVCDNYERNK